MPIGTGCTLEEGKASLIETPAVNGAAAEVAADGAAPANDSATPDGEAAKSGDQD